MISLVNKDSPQVNDEIIQKYLSILEQYKPEYFACYIFKVNLLFIRKLFEKYKQRLENICNQKIELNFSNNHLNRRERIEFILKFDNPILDIGCGEGFFTFTFAKRLEKNNLNYIGIDTDISRISALKNKVSQKGIKNVKLFISIDEFIEKESLSNDSKTSNYDIIMSEVIEHMEVDQAKHLVEQVLEKLEFENLIITSPNRDFNKFYFQNTDEKRHTDHKFEFTKKEFEDFFKQILDNSKTFNQSFKISNQNYQYSFIEIGDKVNNISTTNGIIIKRVVD